MTRLDNPTSEDRLGFGPYVSGIESIIVKASSDDLPFAIGVYGPWGAGKSSFMLQLKHNLEINNYQTLWFNAWKYDSIGDVRGALIHSILQKMKETTNGDDIQGRLDGFIHQTTNGLLKRLGRATVTIGAFGSSVAVPLSVEEDDDFLTVVDEFSKEFESLVGEYLQTLTSTPEKSRKLVIFVDDLDRCLPDNVIAVLEALKLFLDQAPCVFVIGVDRTVVERAIQARYGAGFGDLGRDYLDKIIEYSIAIPQARMSQLESIYGSDVSTKEIFELAAYGNPRNYNRLISAWRIVREVAKEYGNVLDGDADAKKLLIIATAIQVRFPRLHEVCRNSPDRFGLFFERCGGPGSDGDQIIAQGALAYKPFWDDGMVRNFFQQLREKIPGNVYNTMAASTIRDAFNVSASAG
ncbi:MAG: hypothetical protein IIA92_03865 [Chloroflexi bacterium]|nr:hypothetical protein [Chloroflexota bacterium]